MKSELDYHPSSFLSDPFDRFQRLHRGFFRGENFGFGAGQPHATKAPNRRDVNDLDRRILFGFVRGEIDVRGGLAFHDEERLACNEHCAAPKAVEQLYLIRVNVRDHLK